MTSTSEYLPTYLGTQKETKTKYNLATKPLLGMCLPIPFPHITEKSHQVAIKSNKQH